MATNQLNWQLLQPNPDDYRAQFQRTNDIPSLTTMDVQPRLNATLTLFTDQRSTERFMLVKAPDSYDYLSLIASEINQKHIPTGDIIGARYHVNENQITYHPATSVNDNFAATDYCLTDQWLEQEQLFGCLRHTGAKYFLEPGLVHKANGGIMVLSLRTLLSQPLLWLKLKQMVVSQRYDWLPTDETRQYPIPVPSMPIDIKLVLVGDHFELDSFQEIEPEISSNVLYAEFEPELSLEQPDDILTWCSHIHYLSDYHNLPRLSADAFAALLPIAVRFTGDQYSLPMCPVWLTKQLRSADLQRSEPTTTQIEAEHIQSAYQHKLWRESYLLERIRNEVEQDQIHIETQGYTVGQINALSVLEYPGHPQAIGEPSRISCIVHFGDGEVTDVERKAELGGNLHAKGMMIMQAFISAELATEQQLPFSASIVFEQSYGEVDGDSASLAELCSLLSALSLQPINQQFAVTGSVDQFGHVQPIGGVNEKIEAFFDACLFQGLTHSQGVIIPERNMRHLCLRDDVVAAVKNGEFNIFTVSHAAEAISLLTGLPYEDQQLPSILSIMQERIALINNHSKSHFPWPFRWLN